MRYLCLTIMLACLGQCSNTPGESGTLEVVSFSPAEGTKIDCNTTIKYQLKYQISNSQSSGNRTITFKNNQGVDKNYSATAAGGEQTEPWGLVSEIWWMNIWTLSQKIILGYTFICLV